MQIGSMVPFTWEKVVYKTFGLVKVFTYLKFADFNTAENITESLVSEGLVTVRRENARNSPETQRLAELEDAAKAAGKGRWGSSAPSVSFIKFFLLNLF